MSINCKNAQADYIWLEAFSLLWECRKSVQAWQVYRSLTAGYRPIQSKRKSVLGSAHALSSTELIVGRGWSLYGRKHCVAGYLSAQRSAWSAPEEREHTACVCLCVCLMEGEEACKQNKRSKQSLCDWGVYQKPL